LNGIAFKKLTGIEQVKEEIITGRDPSQFVRSVFQVIPSLWRILILYIVIGEPPSKGLFQEITTLLPTSAVVGGDGWLGSYAAKIETEFDKLP